MGKKQICKVSIRYFSFGEEKPQLYISRFNIVKETTTMYQVDQGMGSRLLNVKKDDFNTPDTDRLNTPLAWSYSCWCWPENIELAKEKINEQIIAEHSKWQEIVNANLEFIKSRKIFVTRDIVVD